MSNNTILPQFVGGDGQPLDLLLYMFAACPYCRHVLARAASLGLDLPQADIHQDQAAYRELMQRGGKTTVPCLFINGKPLYESADIIAFLESGVAPKLSNPSTS